MMTPPHFATLAPPQKPRHDVRIAVLIFVLVSLAVAFAWCLHSFISQQGEAADLRTAVRFHDLRDDRLVAVFGWITAFGNWRAMVCLMVGVTVALVLVRRTDLTVVLWTVAAANQLSVSWLKSHFDRPRPHLAYFMETSGSFPSGHAASAVAIWGTLCFLGWRAGWLRGSVALLLAVAIAGAISFSRIYLGEHYLSDVVSGGVLGAIWLTLGIIACEAMARPLTLSLVSDRRRFLARLSVTLGLVATLFAASTLNTPRNQIASNGPAEDCRFAILPPTARGPDLPVCEFQGQPSGDAKDSHFT